jgi:hypothetical protein
MGIRKVGRLLGHGTVEKLKNELVEAREAA